MARASSELPPGMDGFISFGDEMPGYLNIGWVRWPTVTRDMQCYLRPELFLLRDEPLGDELRRTAHCDLQKGGGRSGT